MSCSAARRSRLSTARPKRFCRSLGLDMPS
jgi:hypothetical protein